MQNTLIEVFLRIPWDQKFDKGLKVLQVWELCLNFAMVLISYGSSEHGAHVLGKSGI